MSTPLSVEEAVEQTLKANGPLMAILTGSVWLTREPMENPSVVRQAAGKGALNPLAVVTPLPVIVPDQWEADIMGIITRPFAIYLYQAGPAYDQIQIGRASCRERV